MISYLEKELLFLHNIGLNYCLIREPEDWDSSLDIDILVNNISKASKILIKNGYFCYRNISFHAWFLKYDVDAKHWIHLDMHYGLKFGEITFPEKYINRLLCNPEFNDVGIPKIKKGDYFILLFFHSIIDKNNLDGKHKKQFNSDLEFKIFKTLNKHYYFLPKPLEHYLQKLKKWINKEITSYSILTSVRVQFGIKNNEYNVISQSLLRVKRRVKGLLKTSNMITVVGPDGSGKSSITNAISNLPNIPIKLQYMGPAPNQDAKTIFFLKKILSKLNKQKENFSSNSILGKIIRLLWHFSNYTDLIIRLYRNLWHASGDGVVVFDRYACDMYIRDNKYFNELTYIKFFPKPKRVALCFGSAVHINHRKPELKIEEINEAFSLYKRIFDKYEIKFEEINTTNTSIKGSVETLAKIIMKVRFND